MRPDDMIMVSVDDHLVEPPTCSTPTSRRSTGTGARRSCARTTAPTSGCSTAAEIPNVGLNAVAGRPKEEYGIEPTAFDEMRPGCWDIAERVKDMDAGGVLGSMCFPCFPGFSGRLFAAADDKDLALAVRAGLQRLARRRVVRRGTRAASSRWACRCCGTPSWRPPRCAGSPRRACTRSPSPRTRPPSATRRSTTSTGTRCGRPCVDEDVVLSIHLGSSGQLAFTAADAPMDVLITLQPMNICSAAADLLWSRVIKEYPTIKIALSEGGTGWIPYFLDRLDRTYDMHHLWTGQDFGDRLPSEVFRDHFLTCFIADPVGIRLRDLIGIDNIAWECDYPHSDSSWPEAPEELAAVAVGRARRRARQDHLPERHALVLLRPLRPRAEGRGHRRRAAGQGRRPRREHPVVRQGPLRAHRQGRRPRHHHGDGPPPRPRRWSVEAPAALAITRTTMPRNARLSRMFTVTITRDGCPAACDVAVADRRQGGDGEVHGIEPRLHAVELPLVRRRWRSRSPRTRRGASRRGA